MVTVNIIGCPEHPFRVEFTVIVPVMFEPVLFDGAIHPGIFPVPLAPSPIEVFEFVQLKIEPDGEMIKLPILTGCPGHTKIFNT